MNRDHARVIAIIGLGIPLVAIAAYATLRIVGALAPSDIILSRGPYLQNAQADRITVCWETDEPTTATVRVTGANGSVVFARRTPAAAERHEMVVGGLQPGQVYHYEVRSAGTANGSRQGTFTTPPGPGTPFEFAVWGDSRKGRKTCQRIAELILASGVPMCVHSGDFVGSGVNLFEWNWMFFEPCREMLQSVVLWPAIGNHELGRTEAGLDGRTVYTQAFALPGNERYYSFDYGDAHFLVLDSNHDFYDDPEQYAFAEQDLAATSAGWRFVIWHHPVFNSGTRHDSHVPMRTLYCPLLARHNVDMIITGHEHSYQFSQPIRHYDEPEQRRPYWHLVSAGGGAELYDVRNDELWSKTAASVNHFVLIRLEGDRLTGRAIDIQGSEFDHFEIDKSVPPPEAVAYEWIELDRLCREPAGRE